MSSYPVTSTFALRFLAVALALLAAATLSHAHANGRIVKFERKTAGPYEIALGTIPSPPIVGALHLTVTVNVLDGGRSATDAVIMVSGVGPDEDGPRVGPVEARNNPTNPTFYDGTTAVDRLGLWTFTVEVDSDLGKASADFVLEVKESNPILQLITWVTVVVFLALVGLGLFPFLRDRARKAKRRKTRKPRR